MSHKSRKGLDYPLQRYIIDGCLPGLDQEVMNGGMTGFPLAEIQAKTKQLQ
ncbi:unnamed protein product [Dovyalis caffra]|uniref:Uncharacterized protein n=1 Tax=Dovyalis caffra TaxID=77055 RepID=A0AAV1R8P2_9ROSI|nr:unnamed protein product [Dovyalis caffra]